MQTTTPATMGVRAVSPSTNVQAPPSTLPKPQVQSTSIPVKSISNGQQGVSSPLYNQNAVAGNVGSLDPSLNRQSAQIDNTQTSPQSAMQPPTPTYSGILGQLVQTASQPSQAYLDQIAQANQYNQALNQSRMNEATGLAQNFSNPIPLEFQQGRAQVLQNQYLQQQGALANAFQGAAGLVGQANTQQQLQQTGLGTAAGYAKPELGSIGQVPYSPIDLSQGNILGTTQPGGIGAAGNLLGQFQGAQTAGAAQGGVQAQQYAQVQGYKSALQQGQNLQSQLTDLITSFGLNPSDVNVVNQGLQKIAQNTSSPQYKMLSNYVNDVANTYSQILTPPGGSATDTTRGIASSMLDATAKGQSILDVMKGLDNAAQAKIAGVPTTGGYSSGSTSNAGTIQTAYGNINPNL